MRQIDSKALISEVQFNDKYIKLKSDDILVFTGSNNVGKTQSLKDIFNLIGGKSNGVVVKGVKTYKQEGLIDGAFNLMGIRGDLDEKIELSLPSMEQYSHASIYPKDIKKFKESENFGEFRDVFFGNIQTINRLTVVNPVEALLPGGIKYHPIHFLNEDDDILDNLNKYLGQVFPYKVVVDTGYGPKLPLRLIKNDIFRVDCFENVEPIKYGRTFNEEIRKHPLVNEQGDGVKSLIGVLSYLCIPFYKGFFIDEPEAFLHPPQANVLGRILASDATRGRQVFLATHSPELLKGLIEENSHRVKIVHIKRDGNASNFSVLNNEDISILWKDPLLKYSNILDSLFHKTIVLCESESDCEVYRLINNHNKENSNIYPETLFIQCHGKGKMYKVMSALSALDLDIKAIVDLDVLNDKDIFKKLLKSCGGNWNDINELYSSLKDKIESLSREITKQDFMEAVEEICNKNDDVYLTGRNIQKIRRLLDFRLSGWQKLKEKGVNGDLSDDIVSNIWEIINYCNSCDLYIVPVGELENFIPSVNGHGVRWMEQVIDKYPSFNSDAYKDIGEFISMVIPNDF